MWSTCGLLRNNVSVKSKLQHPPLSNRTLLFKFPPTQAKMPFKCPTQGSIKVIKCPHPGDKTLVQSGRNHYHKVTQCSAFLRVSCTISKTSARVSWGVPNTRKQMKARGRRPSAFIVFECLETLMKPDARVFEMTSPKKQYKIMQCCIFPIFL